ncbi:MAG: NusG domain II-containing protein [Candidatus Accumulibacter sp.]|nr:NusG domain II-containing protein [Accumulibacter sp.]
MPAPKQNVEMLFPAISLFRPGDCFVFLAACVFCFLSFSFLSRGGIAEKAVVRQGGHIFARIDLSRASRIDIPGPIGTTTVVVENRRARVLSDPGSHQYCVRQGWIKRAGDIAICAPNEVSLEIEGSDEVYDSLNY